jgi:hypothetical protein
MMRAVLCVVAPVVVCCQGLAQPEEPSSGETQGQAVPTASATATKEATARADPGDQETADKPACPPPVSVSPWVVATEWPSRLGQRVWLRVRPVRALGLGETVVAADSQRFLVLAPPGAPLAGTHAFVVVGSATAALGGRVRLPQLLLNQRS